MSPLGTWQCDGCRKQVRGAKHRTMLGRTICTSCQHRFDATVLGGLMAQQQGGSRVSNAIPDTVAVVGARSWIRRALCRDDQAKDSGSHSAPTESAHGDPGATRQT